MREEKKKQGMGGAGFWARLQKHENNRFHVGSEVDVGVRLLDGVAPLPFKWLDSMGDEGKKKENYLQSAGRLACTCRDFDGCQPCDGGSGGSSPWHGPGRHTRTFSGLSPPHCSPVRQLISRLSVPSPQLTEHCASGGHGSLSLGWRRRRPRASTTPTKTRATAKTVSQVTRVFPSTPAPTLQPH